MNDKIKQLMGDSKSNYRRQFEETQRLVKKWERTGLLDELDTEYDKHGMAVLLENQARQLIDEISKTGGANQEEWSGVALPLVRRIFAEIAAKEFVSVQPMNLPSGLVFYLDFKYGTAQPGFETAPGASLQANSLFGITNQSTEASEGLYGAGRFGYSINDFNTTKAATTGSVAWSDVKYSADLSGSLSGLQKIIVNLGSLSIDKNGIRAFEVSGSNITAYYPAYTSVDSSDLVTFIVAGTVPASQNVVVWYHKQPTDSTRGDFEAPGDPSWGNSGVTGEQYDPSSGNVGANSIEIPELNVDLRQEPIVAKTRKLKAVWTPEFAQDLNAYHSVDAENELTSMLSEYVSMEIDLEILDMLIVNALTTSYWSAQVGTVLTGANQWAVQDNVQGHALAYTQPTWFQTLGIKLQDVSNQIHSKTMRGGANFMVVSPKVATIVESMNGFTADTDGNKFQYAMGVQKSGGLMNRWTVYKNPYMKENVILMGFRGSQFLETGAVYAPYIPLIMTPIIFDPVNLTPRKGVMTRYAKKIVRPEFYANVVVTHLNYV